jgi:S-DNA-T family DNA segregation ATPase FtsK/SpoIIIE
MAAKKSFKKNIVTNSMYSLLSGVGLQALMPMFVENGGGTENLLLYLLKAFGILGIFYYAWTWSKFDKLFENLGLGIDGAYPIMKSKRKTDYSEIYKFTLPRGLSLADFDKHKDAIEQFLGRKIDIKYTYKEIYIEVYNENQKTLYEYVPTKIKGEVPIMVGYDRKGELHGCDLSDGEPHMGIYGETGSGKSTVLRAIITNLILMSNVILHLVDLKNGAELNIFRKSSKVKSFCRSINETEKLLEDLVSEVDRRYDLFYENDVKDIKEYNKKFKNKKMNYQVLVIDEFADLKPKSDSMKSLKELGRKSRASGVHIIIATQRPSSTVLDGDIKANVTSILGLKTMNGTNSSVAMDETGLEKLRGKGHGIFKRGGKVEIQAPFLDPDRARDLIKHTFIDKKVEKEVKNGNVSEDSILEAVSNL